MEHPSSCLSSRLPLLVFLLCQPLGGSSQPLQWTLIKNVTVLEEGRPVRFVCHTERSLGPANAVLWTLDEEQLEDFSPLGPSSGGRGGSESSLTVVPDRDLTGRLLSCLLFLANGSDLRAELLLDIKYPPSIVAITGSSVYCDQTACGVALSPGRTYDFACHCLDSQPVCRLGWELTRPRSSATAGRRELALVGERSRAVDPSPHQSGRGWNASIEVGLQVGVSGHAWKLSCLAWYPDDSTPFREIALNVVVQPHESNGDGAAGERLDWPTVFMYAGVGLCVLAVSCIGVLFVVCLRRRGGRGRGQIELEGNASRANPSAYNQSYQCVASRDDRTLRSVARPLVPEFSDESDSWLGSFPRDRLDLQELVGEGSFGLVYKATAYGITSAGRADTVAVKTMKARTASSDRENFEKELTVCMSIPKHPHVIAMLGFCTKEEPFFLIFEFAGKGNLKSFLRQRVDEWTVASGPPIEPADLLTFAYQIASGMGHLASLNIIHRDLAARNILLDNAMMCKLSDFGFARDVVDGDYYNMTSDEALPIRWMALESITENTYTTKSDVWSFGVFLWELVTMGSHPYTGASVKEVIAILKKGDRLKKPPHCSDGLYKLMIKCWCQSEIRRPDFRILERTLRHMAEDASNYVQMTQFNP